MPREWQESRPGAGSRPSDSRRGADGSDESDGHKGDHSLTVDQDTPARQRELLKNDGAKGKRKG